MITLSNALECIGQDGLTAGSDADTFTASFQFHLANTVAFGNVCIIE